MRNNARSRAASGLLRFNGAPILEAKIPTGFSEAAIPASALPLQTFSLVKQAVQNAWKFQLRRLHLAKGKAGSEPHGHHHSPLVPSSSARCPVAVVSSSALCTATVAPQQQPRQQRATRRAGLRHSGTVTSPSAPRTAGQRVNGKR